MRDPRIFGLLLAFFTGSWLSNGHIIRTTTVLLENASLGLILAASSMAGLGFFVILRILNRWQRPFLGGLVLLPLWGMIQLAPLAFPQRPIVAALIALLFGELVKWHLYSQVLSHWGPMGANRVLGWAVLAYELGTVTAALYPQPLLGLELVALLPLYGTLLVRGEGHEVALSNDPSAPRPWASVLPWMLACGLVAGFLRVSADTGLKYAIRLQDADTLRFVSHFYLVSALFTITLGAMKRVRWLAPKLGHGHVAFTVLGVTQVIFAFALLTGSGVLLVVSAALQRSVDKIFYQPTMQLLTSGFSLTAQESLRRWHVVGFLGLGSLAGLLAFAGHGLLGDPRDVLWGITFLHALVAGALFGVGFCLVRNTIKALDQETRVAGHVGGSRPMAMLALLSPRHFLVHALMWANRHGGDMQGLPQDLMQGLTAEHSTPIVQTFYLAFPRLDETQQLALVRLAAYMDRGPDREFLMTVALEQVSACRRARRLAAHHLVKVHGREARPLLRRSRGKKSPLPKRAA